MPLSVLHTHLHDNCSRRLIRSHRPFPEPVPEAPRVASLIVEDTSSLFLTGKELPKRWRCSECELVRPVTHNLPPRARVPFTATESESPYPLEIDLKYHLTPERMSAAWGTGLGESEQREGNKTVSWMK